MAFREKKIEEENCKVMMKLPFRLLSVCDGNLHIN